MGIRFAAGAFALAFAATPALAVDLMHYERPSALVQTRWTGFYVGANLGGGFSDSGNLPPGLEFDVVTGAGISTFPSPLSATGGVIGGGQIGYNYQIPWLRLITVVGVEADIQGAGLGGSWNTVGAPLMPFVFPPAVSSHSSIDWFGTVRGRAGIAVIPNVLIFGTGGFAYGGGGYDLSFTRAFPGGVAFAQGGGSGGLTGWTAGGGVEWGFMPNLSAKVEYLYVDLGNSPGFVAPEFFVSPFGAGFAGNAVVGQGAPNRFNAVRAGLNWRFGGAGVGLGSLGF